MSDQNRTYQRTRRREFRITVGLREGYHQDGPLHLADEVTQVAANWMAERLALGEPVISGMITAGEVIYAGKAQGGGVQQGREPVAMSSCPGTGGSQAPMLPRPERCGGGSGHK